VTDPVPGGEEDAARRADDALQARARGRLGAILRDKYRLDYVLGLGGAATVYAATHRNGNRVALKLLHPELACEADIRTRFLREGYVANKVQHAGAVAVIDDDVTTEGWAFLVMDLLHGTTVQGLWEARSLRLPAPCVTAIVLQLLDVIGAAHDKGIVHRDLKPDNVFLTPTGEVKVLDFGVARLRDGSAHKTDLGTVVGTPAFMAPEQANSRANEIDGKTDLWAIGSIAFALLAGDVVHPAENSGQTLIHAATRPARALAPLVPDAPAGVVAVFQRALAFEKADRWPSAGAMRDALARAAEAAYGQVPGPIVIAGALRGLVPPLREVPPYDAHTSGAAAPGRVSTPLVVVDAPSYLLDDGAGARGRAMKTVVKARPDAANPHEGGTWSRSLLGVGIGVAAAAVVALVVLLRVAPSPPPAQAAPASANPPSPAPSAPEVAAAPPATGAPPAPEPTESSHASDSAPTVAASAAPLPTLRPRVGQQRPPTAVAKASSAGACTPPFTIDPTTGRKKWKTECL
jgi:serine/threonine-protein kinase